MVLKIDSKHKGPKRTKYVIKDKEAFKKIAKEVKRKLEEKNVAYALFAMKDHYRLFVNNADVNRFEKLFTIEISKAGPAPEKEEKPAPKKAEKKETKPKKAEKKEAKPKKAEKKEKPAPKVEEKPAEVVEKPAPAPEAVAEEKEQPQQVAATSEGTVVLKSADSIITSCIRCKHIEKANDGWHCKLHDVMMNVASIYVCEDFEPKK